MSGYINFTFFGRPFQASRKVGALIILLLLVGCADEPVLVRVEHNEYELIDVDPPKRFRVILKNINTGDIKELYVAKRCSTWDRNKIGDRYTLTEKIYQTSSGEKVRHGDLRKTFRCE